MLFAPNPPGQVVNPGLPRSAYLHIPFCRRRCYYCDFPISVVGDRRHGENSGMIQQYVAVLSQEISESVSFGQPLETIFFGGGTPSLLSVHQLKAILAALDQKFGIVAKAEISLEIDPATFTLEQLQGYKTAGVNRFSLGVQAFQDELLKVCGRSHSVADIYDAVRLIEATEITNFSLDLISGLPHQTLEQWQASLKAAIALNPAHLSCYDLIVETGTAFSRYYQAGSAPLPADETAAQMYRLAQKILTEVGYDHYEISNYARPGYQCQHNRVYWENRPYYAFGMGAASYLNGVRFTRPRTRQDYYRWVEEMAQLTQPEIPNAESPQDRLLETLMLGLRLAQGLSLSKLREQFGRDTVERIWQCLLPYYRQGWVEVVGSAEVEEIPPQLGNLRLSDPEGFLFSNTVLATLFSQLEIPTTAEISDA